jgi:hypothetical protein
MKRSARHSRKTPVSKAKAGEILSHGSVHGKPLTKAQKGLFGAIRGGSYRGARRGK